MTAAALCKDCRDISEKSWRGLHRGLSKGRWLRGAQLLSMMLGVYAIVFTYMSLSQVTHEKRLRGMERLMVIGLLDAESGQRAYLLTDDALFLVQYRAGLKALDLYQPVYKDFLQDKESVRLYQDVATLLALKRAEMQLTITTHDSKGSKAAVEIVRNRIGHVYTERIYDLLRQIHAIEGRKVAPFQIWHSPNEQDIHDPNRIFPPAARLMQTINPDEPTFSALP